MKIYNILKGKITYDYTALQANKNEAKYYTSRNMENGLLNHTCVCAGYADILKNVLAELNIESRYVEGYTDKGELHAWNQVRIDGMWYNVDLTWDSINNNNTYCLKDDRSFARTHQSLLERSEGVERCVAAMPMNNEEYERD